jgi:hypothetical protein
MHRRLGGMKALLLGRGSSGLCSLTEQTDLLPGRGTQLLEAGSASKGQVCVAHGYVTSKWGGQGELQWKRARTRDSFRLYSYSSRWNLQIELTFKGVGKDTDRERDGAILKVSLRRGVTVTCRDLPKGFVRLIGLRCTHFGTSLQVPVNWSR